MRQGVFHYWLASTITLSFLAARYPAEAQIVPDATLPVNSTVTPSGNTNIIEGGTRAGSNLFHSFREFSVPTGGEAFFNNAADIQNIFSRITGGSISNIDGLIRANGTANLFLLNPNGIIFGPNARLNIGGSFLASSANSVNFADGTQFSATPTQSTPLLTISVPIGLQLGPTPGQIRVQNAGHNLSIDPVNGAILGRETLGGLQVQPGRSLTLVGGEVKLEGGILQAPGGRVELGGLAETGIIGLNGDGTLSLPDGIARADVFLTNRAAVNVIGSGGGNLVINARNLEILGENFLSAGIGENLGSINAQAGNITLNATGTINIGQLSVVENRVNPNGTGNSGDINIQAQSLSITDGSFLSASTFGRGNGGNINVSVTNALTMAGEQNESTSRISSVVDSAAVGNGGNINITAGSVSLSNGAQLNAYTSGQGNAGSVSIQATNSVSLSNSQIFNDIAPGAVGNSSGITITAGSLSLTDGAQLAAGTEGQGNGGSISVQATESVSLLRNSAFISDVYPGAVGNGGNITIQAGSLSLTDGGQLVTAVKRASENLPAGQGNAGNITIVARDDVTIAGRSSSDVLRFSGLYSRAEFGAVGNGGNIEIQAGSVSLLDGATLSSPHFGIQGNAGNISVRARDLVLLSNSDISSFLGSPSSETVGRGGSITILAGSLSMSDEANLQTSTAGQGDAGSVFVQAQGSVSLANSQIYTNVFPKALGNGGDITILTGSLSLKDGAFLSADTNGRGNAGNISVQAKDSVSLTGPVNISFPLASISSGIGQEAEGNGGNIWIQTGSLSLSNASLINSSNLGGRGDAGSISLQVNDSLSLANLSFITTTLDLGAIGKGGDINITAGSLSLADRSSLGASTSAQGNAGNISVQVDGSVSLANRSFVNTSVFSPGVGKGGNIDITAGSLFLTDGSALGAYTDSQGNAGNISVRVDDSVSLTNRSFIVTSVGREGVGNGGDISITASSLLVSNASFLSAETSGQGDAGDIAIEASNTISFDGESFASSVVQAEAVGDGGTITLKAPLLSLTNGSRVTVTSVGDGAAGNVIIDADSVRLDNSLLAAETAQGNQGNIEVRASSLILRNNSRITTNAFRTATGGNITLNTDVLAALENSDISANAQDARGGRVIINAQAIFGLQPRTREELQTLLGIQNLDPIQLPSSDITAISQQQGPELQGTVQVNTPDIDPSRGLIELPQNFVDIIGLVVDPCSAARKGSSFTVTGRGGIPASPNEPLNGETVLVDLVTLDAEDQGSRAPQEPRSRQQTPRDAIASTEPSTEIVEATGWVINSKGEVVLTAEVPSTTPDRLGLTPASCHVQEKLKIKN